MRQDAAMTVASGHYRGSRRKRPLPRRIAVLALAALLSACAGPTPRPPAPAPVGGAIAVPGANDVLIRTLGLIGTPYRRGGNTPEGGFDCSGLVRFVFQDAAGLSLPRTSQQMSQVPAPKVARERLAPGDLVFFGRRQRVTHVGVYVGEGRFVHAPNEGGTVRIDPLSGPYWRENYLFARRPLAGATSAP